MTWLFALALATGTPPTEVVAFRYESRSANLIESAPYRRRPVNARTLIREYDLMVGKRSDRHARTGILTMTRQGDAVWLQTRDDSNRYRTSQVLYHPDFRLAYGEGRRSRQVTLDHRLTDWYEVLIAMVFDDPRLVTNRYAAGIIRTPDFRIAEAAMPSSDPGRPYAALDRQANGGYRVQVMGFVLVLRPEPVQMGQPLLPIPEGMEVRDSRLSPPQYSGRGGQVAEYGWEGSVPDVEAVREWAREP